jgi:hypothetical protein
MQSPQTSSSRTGGKRSGVTIISSQRSDMTAAGQSIVRTSFPTRSDKRHPTPVAPFKQGTEEGVKDNQFIQQNSLILAVPNA